MKGGKVEAEEPEGRTAAVKTDYAILLYDYLFTITTKQPASGPRRIST